MVRKLLLQLFFQRSSLLTTQSFVASILKHGTIRLKCSDMLKKEFILL